MKKIFRVFYRITLILLMAFFTIITFVKISESKNFPSVLGIIIYISLISVTIVSAVMLLSHPTVKLSLGKKAKIKKGKKPQEFELICKQLMDECGTILEEYRKMAIIYICLIILGLAIIFLMSLLISNFDILISIGLILTVPFVILYLYNQKKFNEEFKRFIMPTIIKNIGPKLQYYYDGNENMINKYSSTFPNNEEYNGFESTDYIYGKMNDISFEICKISLVNYSEKNGENINTLETFLFSHNKIKFSTPSTLTLKPNNLFYRYKSNRVQMDSEEFEKYFDIFSDSELIAMQILTHDVMEELVTFYLKFRCKFEIVIKNNNIFIKFKTGDVFNPKVFKKVTDSDLLWTYYTILNFVTNLCVKINKTLEGTEI